jgi:hypothetical protein
MSVMGEIRLVRYSDILGAPNAAELIEEYGKECMVQVNPQAEIYARMEDSGALQCFGVYDDQDLVGFASVLTAVMPHSGIRIGTVESIFVSAGKRPSGASLMVTLEKYAKAAGCAMLLYSARVGSRLEWILSQRRECRHTHAVFARGFA